jgi:hypothetical protein
VLLLARVELNKEEKVNGVGVVKRVRVEPK